MVWNLSIKLKISSILELEILYYYEKFRFYNIYLNYLILIFKYLTNNLLLIFLFLKR